MRRLSYVVCDVFTDVPLTGNQLAVFTDGRDLDTIRPISIEVGLLPRAHGSALFQRLRAAIRPCALR